MLDTFAPRAVIFATKPSIVRPSGSVGVRDRIHAVSNGKPRMLSQLHTSDTLYPDDASPSKPMTL